MQRKKDILTWAIFKSTTMLVLEEMTMVAQRKFTVEIFQPGKPAFLMPYTKPWEYPSTEFSLN